MLRPLPLICLLFLSIALHAQPDYLTEITAYRDSVDRVFADSTTTILMPEDTAGFHGLSYFPVSEKFQVKAKFTRAENAKAEKMKTSGTRTPLYKPYGSLSFTLDGKECILLLYQFAEPGRPELADHLLLAFSDLTSGSETYGGGRYLDFTTADISGEMILDFNYCYNPYCAYNHKYSCVMPPPGNHLDVRIEAGVKKFHD